MTPLGQKMRELREARGVTLKQMATALNVSSAYLSALEHGRRGRPTWILLQRIIQYFNVIWDEAEELQRLAELSDPKVTIETGGLPPEATELANRLARDISRLSPDDLVALRTADGVHALRPGITGWAQINGRDDLPIVEKARLDREYLERATLSLDIRIIAATALAALQGRGVSH